MVVASALVLQAPKEVVVFNGIRKTSKEPIENTDLWLVFTDTTLNITVIRH
jgi:hypothetical protein